MNNIEALPLVVLSQTFAARASSLVEVRDYVDRCLDRSALLNVDRAAVIDGVTQALLDAAGPASMIEVSFRFTPRCAEIEVLRSHVGDAVRVRCQIRVHHCSLLSDP